MLLKSAFNDKLSRQRELCDMQIRTDSRLFSGGRTTLKLQLWRLSDHQRCTTWTSSTVVNLIMMKRHCAFVAVVFSAWDWTRACYERLLERCQSDVLAVRHIRHDIGRYVVYYEPCQHLRSGAHRHSTIVFLAFYLSLSGLLDDALAYC